jgi:uncharacterized protein involved in exopolysaccharide biosynthesis
MEATMMETILVLFIGGFVGVGAVICAILFLEYLQNHD